MPDLAYVNGEFLPLAEARVPINDRAYYYADAVYEVCATLGGRVFLLDAHLNRLERNLRGVRIACPVDRRRLAALFKEGIRKAGYKETIIYLQISRGVAPREKKFPAETAPILILTFREKPRIAPEKRARGIEVILVPDDRWARCDYKTVMLLPNVLAHQKALDDGKDDAIFYDREKMIIHEATGANVFVVRAGRVATPEENSKILPGTVRRYLMDLARGNGIAVEERPIGVAELHEADETFFTGTTSEVLPVVRVDDRAIGDGVPGPMTLRFHRMFLESLGHRGGNP
jgi:D-alanine transaminase